MGGGVVSWKKMDDFAAAKTTAGSALISGTAITVATHYVSLPACNGSSYDSTSAVVNACTCGAGNS